MAIAFVAAGTTREATSASIILARPTGLSAGDLMIASFNVDTNPTVTTVPTGWTLAAGPTTAGGASGNTAATYYKIATSGDTTTTDWTWIVSSSQPHSGFIIALSGVDQTTPMDATATSLANASSTSVTATGLTTVTDNAWLYWFGAYNSGTFTITAPSGYTSRATGTTYRVTGATNIKTPAGATGNQVGSAGTARENVGQLLAIRPAGTSSSSNLGTSTVAKTAYALSSTRGVGRATDLAFSAYNLISGSFDVTRPIIFDDFTGTNGSAPPSPWIVAMTGTGGSATIQSNAIRARSGTVAYNGVALTRGSTTYGDLDVTLTVTLNSVSQEQYPGIGYRMAGGTNGWSSPFAEVNNGYIVWIDNAGTSPGLHFARETGGSIVGGTEIISTFTPVVGGTYCIRVKAVGSSHQASCWLSSSVQTSWLISTTDSTYTSGLIGFRQQANFSSVDATFDSFTLDDFSGNTANLGSASLSVAAQALSYVDGVSQTAAALGLTASALQRGTALASAALAIAGYPLTSQTRMLGAISVGLIANKLSFASLALSKATDVPFVANRLSSALNLQLASLTFSANALSGTRNLGTANLGVSAYPLSTVAVDPNGWNSLSINWNDLSANWNAPNAGTSTANLGTTTDTYIAYALAASSQRNFTSASLALSANGLATAGFALTQASLTALANNLSSTRNLGTATLSAIANNLNASNRNLGTATLSLNAFNLSSQVTGVATLGQANLSLNAQTLSVGLSPRLATAVALSAYGVARAAALASASVSVSASDLGQLRAATMALATTLFSAYGLALTSPNSALMFGASMTHIANQLRNLAMLSTGLASLSLVAEPFSETRSEGVGSLSTAATNLASTRQSGYGLLNLTAYGLGIYRPSALGTASLALTAYGLSTKVGITQGAIDVELPLVGICVLGPSKNLNRGVPLSGVRTLNGFPSIKIKQGRGE